MKFSYLGFTHETTGVRCYSFEGAAVEGIRKRFLVTADIALLTKHRVQIQEVPIMCLRLLESPAETEPHPEFSVLTEKDMMAHVSAKAAEMAAKKKPKRFSRPANEAAPAPSWRPQQPVWPQR